MIGAETEPSPFERLWPSRVSCNPSAIALFRSRSRPRADRRRAPGRGARGRRGGTRNQGSDKRSIERGQRSVMVYGRAHRRGQLSIATRDCVDRAPTNVELI